MKTHFTPQEMRLVKRSYARCFLHGDFIIRFLETLAALNQEIAPYIEKTPLDRIMLLLRQGVNCIIMYAEEKFAGEFCLEEVRISHSRKHMGIKPEYYESWIQALLLTLQELDPEYNEELGNLWNSVARKGIEYIEKGF